MQNIIARSTHIDTERYNCSLSESANSKWKGKIIHKVGKYESGKYIY
jgi:hypothetical protein